MPRLAPPVAGSQRAPGGTDRPKIAQQRERFRFLHVSTDEVFGSPGAEGLFAETTPYMRPLVRVVIVNHNGGLHLRRCVACLVRQTAPRFEAVIVDTASTT